MAAVKGRRRKPAESTPDETHDSPVKSADPRSPFRALASAARAVVTKNALEGDAIVLLARAAEEATTLVPEDRRADWQRMIAGLRREESGNRRRARIWGVVRACRLFDRRARERAAPRVPLTIDSPVEKVVGLGPSAASALLEHGVRTVGDLLQTLPKGAIDLRAPLEGAAVLEAARRGDRRVVALRGTVRRTSVVPMRGRRAVRVALDSSGISVDLWWFFFFAGVRSLQGEIVAVGVPSVDPRRPNVARIAHPRIVAASRVGGVEPVYAVSGVSSARLAPAMARIVGEVDVTPLDPMPAPIVARQALPPIEAVMRGVHAPSTLEEQTTMRDALRARLAWAEACWLVLRRLERERALGGAKSKPLKIDARATKKLVDALGFEPTRAQRRAIDVIAKRLDSGRPARVLLTGDVGTGKTAVLLAAAAQAHASGAQVAILAPTTILAEQYLDAVGPLARASEARIALLPKNAGPDRAQHARVAEAASRGTVDVVVGTHALLSEGVRFQRLGLVVVDEQHRLGVAQRLALVGKSDRTAPHLLTVSATPIPRTLALALRGEIETAHLDERPPGRRTPETTIRSRDEWPEIADDLRSTMAQGDSAYVVCSSIEPLTLDDGTPDEGASPGAKARAAELAKSLGASNVALVHGALPDAERRRALARFRKGEVKILVGTTMLEVGVDVPAATLMVLDGADRFGLAQVHQLRGRVGRGEKPGRCLLVHGEPLGALARARLEAVAASSDGLEVARADLRLRGAGDLEGARQSGEEAGFRFLDPLADEDLIAQATKDVEAIFGGSSAFEEHELAGLRRALARFDADAAARDLGIARGEAG